MDGWMRFTPDQEREAEKKAQEERIRMFGDRARPLSEAERLDRRLTRRREEQLKAWIP